MIDYVELMIIRKVFGRNNESTEEHIWYFFLEDMLKGDVLDEMMQSVSS